MPIDHAARRRVDAEHAAITVAYWLDGRLGGTVAEQHAEAQALAPYLRRYLRHAEAAEQDGPVYLRVVEALARLAALETPHG